MYTVFKLNAFTYFLCQQPLVNDATKVSSFPRTFAVNHSIDKWGRHLTLEGNIFNTVYDCYSLKGQCHNYSTVKLSLAVMLLFYFALNITAPEMIVFLTAKMPCAFLLTLEGNIFNNVVHFLQLLIESLHD